MTEPIIANRIDPIATNVKPATMYTIIQITDKGNYGSGVGGKSITYTFTLDPDLETEFDLNEEEKFYTTESTKDKLLKKICDVLDTYYFGQRHPHITKTAWDSYMSDSDLTAKLENGVINANQMRKQEEDAQKKISMDTQVAKQKSAAALPMKDRLFLYTSRKNIPYYFKVSEALVEQFKSDLEQFKSNDGNQFMADGDDEISPNLIDFMVFAKKNSEFFTSDTRPLQLNEKLYVSFKKDKQEKEAAEQAEKNVAGWTRDKFWNWMNNFFETNANYSNSHVSINFDDRLDFLDKLIQYYPDHANPGTINGTTYYLTFKIKETDKTKGVKAKCEFAIPDGAWAPLKQKLDAAYKELADMGRNKTTSTEQKQMLEKLRDTNLGDIYTTIETERKICSYKSAIVSSFKSVFGRQGGRKSRQGSNRRKSRRGIKHSSRKNRRTKRGTRKTRKTRKNKLIK